MLVNDVPWTSCRWTSYEHFLTSADFSGSWKKGKVEKRQIEPRPCLRRSSKRQSFFCGVVAEQQRANGAAKALRNQLLMRSPLATKNSREKANVTYTLSSVICPSSRVIKGRSTLGVMKYVVS